MNVFDAVSFLIDKSVKAGADAAESCGILSRSVSASCRMGKTESLEYSEMCGVDLRVFKGKRQAVVSSCVLDEKTLGNLAKTAVDMAKATPEDAFCGLADAVALTTDYKILDVYDSFEPTAQLLLDTAMQAENAALENKKITNSDGAGAGYSYTKALTATTAGFSCAREKTHSSLSVSVLAAGENAAKERDYDYTSAVYFSDLTAPADIGKSAAERTVKKLNAQKISSARLPVVLDRRTARRFFGYFIGAINGSAAAKKTTFLADGLGTRLFPENVRISENPFQKRGPASRPCDAEGIACVERALIDNGVLTTFLTDLSAARQLDVPPTGHAVRGFGGVPFAAASNVSVTGGLSSPEDLIKDIQNGLYVTDVFGSGTNSVTGDYSQGASGFLIENGEITTPVHEITIAGNLRNLFASVILANDETTAFALNAPTVLLPDVSVSGK